MKLEFQLRGAPHAHVSACLRVGRGLKPSCTVSSARMAPSGFGLPSGGPWIETYRAEQRWPRRSRFGLPSGGPWIETSATVKPSRVSPRFGLPSGGPWIETPRSADSPPCGSRFGLPSGGPWIETAISVRCGGLLLRFGLPSGGPWIETCACHQQCPPSRVSACLRVGRGLKQVAV